jgi:hypothetical protein
MFRKRDLFTGFVLFLSFLLLFTGCSKDDDDNTPSPNPPTLSETPDFTINIPATFPESLYTVIDTVIGSDSVRAIRLLEFFKLRYNELHELASPGTRTTDSSFFAIFTYVPVGSDGFSPRGQIPNIRWDQIVNGYINITTENDPSLFYSISMEGKHRVKHLAKFDLYRTISVDTPDSIVQFEIAPLERINHANFDSVDEPAVRLTSFITDYITAQPETKTYGIFASDDFGADSLTWDQLSTGYWLITTQRTIFDDSTLTSGSYKLRNLSRITVR